MQQDPKGTPCRNGGAGGMHQVSGWVHMDVGVLGLPYRVSTHDIQQSVHGGEFGGEGAKNEGRETESGVPSTNLCTRPSPQHKSCVRGCAGQRELPRGWGTGMLPRPLHRPLQGPRTGRSPPPCGDGRLAWLGTAPGCRQQHPARTTRTQAGREFAGTLSNKSLKKGFESCRRENSGKWGKFVRNLYEFGTNAYEIYSLGFV